jgi:hypothetical protein
MLGLAALLLTAASAQAQGVFATPQPVGVMSAEQTVTVTAQVAGTVNSATVLTLGQSGLDFASGVGASTCGTATLAKILSFESSLFGGDGLDFQGMVGLSLRCLLGPSEGIPARPAVHRQDEPTKLSLGMVASQQSPLPFHLDVDSSAQATFSAGKSLLPS